MSHFQLVFYVKALGAPSKVVKVNFIEFQSVNFNLVGHTFYRSWKIELWVDSLESI